MNHEVFITCALTGAGDTSGKSDLIPVTPEQIAESGIQAAKAGAAVIHIHVRDPQSGAPARGLSPLGVCSTTMGIKFNSSFN